VYYGISLGGIEGAVSLAADPPYDAVVLHVGGASWSTMLERSSNWPLFEALVEATIEDPWQRQVSYAASQLYWDMADPMSFVDDLSDADFLLQEAIGDEQVPNLTTELLARSIGLPLLTPSATQPFAVQAETAPLQGRALAQFDPETALPAMENRPAAVTHAHTEPRLWATTQAQTLHYLDPTDPGEVIHPCGSSPCTASNADTVVVE